MTPHGRASLIQEQYHTPLKRDRSPGKPQYGWREFFSIWFCALAGFCLPLSLLSTLNSQLIQFSWAEIGAQYMAALLFCSVLAGVFSGITWACAETTVGTGNGRFGDRETWIALNTLAATLVIGYQMLRGFRDWLYQSFYVSLEVPLWVLIGLFCLILVCIYMAARLGTSFITLLSNKAAIWISAGREPAILLLIISALFLLADGRITQRSVAHYQAADSQPAAPGNEANSNRPNILLITLDSLSAQNMSLYGSKLPTTPRLAEFARRSFVFERFYASCNMTTPAVISMHLGVRPWRHRVYRVSGALRQAPDLHSIAESLHEAGYESSAFVANPAANPALNMFASGFDYLSPELLDSAEYRIAHYGIGMYPALSMIRLQNLFPFNAFWSLLLRWRQFNGNANRLWYDPNLVFVPARNYLAKRRSVTTRPFFSWLHVFPPHYPYVAGPGFLYRYLPDQILDSSSSQSISSSDFYPASAANLIERLVLRYDEHIAYVDDLLGNFLAKMEADGLLKQTIVIISADHGEMFGKGFYHHGGPLLYEPLIHIPLIIHLPDQKSGQRIRELAEQVDLLPTIADLAHISISPNTDGCSLAPLLEGKKVPPREVYSMNFERSKSQATPRDGTVALIEGDFKYIHYLGANTAERQDELFNLFDDPGELNDLIATATEARPAMKKKIVDTLGRAGNNSYR